MRIIPAEYYRAQDRASALVVGSTLVFASLQALSFNWCCPLAKAVENVASAPFVVWLGINPHMTFCMGPTVSDLRLWAMKYSLKVGPLNALLLDLVSRGSGVNKTTRDGRHTRGWAFDADQDHVRGPVSRERLAEIWEQLYVMLGLFYPSGHDLLSVNVVMVPISTYGTKAIEGAPRGRAAQVAEGFPGYLFARVSGLAHDAAVARVVASTNAPTSTTQTVTVAAPIARRQATTPAAPAAAAVSTSPPPAAPAAPEPAASDDDDSVVFMHTKAAPAGAQPSSSTASSSLPSSSSNGAPARADAPSRSSTASSSHGTVPQPGPPRKKQKQMTLAASWFSAPFILAARPWSCPKCHYDMKGAEALYLRCAWCGAVKEG